MTETKNSNTLKELYLTLIENRKKIILYVILGTVISFFSGYFIIKDEYTSSATFIPRVDSGFSPSSLGGVSGLSSLAGISLGGASEDVFPPNLYNEVLSDDVFCKEVLSSEIISNDGMRSTIGEYLLKNKSTFNPIDLIKGLVGLNKSKGFTQLPDSVNININTEDERYVIEEFRDKCRISTSLTDGISMIEVKMPDPLVSAQVTSLLLNFLQTEILEYKMSKSQEDLNFLNTKLAESNDEFLGVQERLARFLESNRALSSELAKIELRNLESEYQLTFNLFNDLSLKVADAEFNLQKNTPSIYLISKPNVPLRSSSLGSLHLLILCSLSMASITIGLFHLKIIK